tara:strand:+ start:2087 stop:2737 length:651 start_codon:yes stop_codon:yes gene_type:complete
MRALTSLIGLLFISSCPPQIYETPAEHVASICELEVSPDISRYSEEIAGINDPLKEEQYCDILQGYLDAKTPSHNSFPSFTKRLTHNLDLLYSLQDHANTLQSLGLETNLEYDIRSFIEFQRKVSINRIVDVFQKTQDQNIPGNYDNRDISFDCQMADHPDDVKDPSIEISAICFQDKSIAISEYRENTVRSAIRSQSAPDYIMELANLETQFMNF